MFLRPASREFGEGPVDRCTGPARLRRRVPPGIGTPDQPGGGFTAYGTYYTHDRSLFLAKAAWLARDSHVLDRWTATALASADSLLAAEAGLGDRWGGRSFLELKRALALAFRGDTAAALAATDQAAHMPIDRDALDGAQMLDHLVVVDIVSGRHARAIDRIEQLLSIPTQMVRPRLRLDPSCDPLRTDPRFQALLQGC